MACNVAIAAMVKTPGLSPVKTRLAKDIGKGNALRVYHSLVSLTESVMLATELPCNWAVAEEEGLSHPLWQKLPTILQHGLSLGDRIFSIQEHLLATSPSFIVIGADTPSLAVSDILAAAIWLSESSTPRHVIGPACDGGFYLFGANYHVSAATWQSVTYSAATTASELLELLPKTADKLKLPERSDLDCNADLIAQQPLLPKSIYLSD